MKGFSWPSSSSGTGRPVEVCQPPLEEPPLGVVVDQCQAGILQFHGSPRGEGGFSPREFRRDIAGAVADMKAKQGGELQVHGSGALIRWLLANDLVDEITLFVCPVIIGQGTRLFPDTGPGVALELVDSRSIPKGITI